ncbi:hypothetical protein K437DRAFT_10576 [Tilletiaria anomala UBC 951]|uniref:Uncharacterized protein n=1 Tax=Tilletiaria anomala (strain ATCC 24038 / CBS 436.72 / UBC 951) TaxID=1037660 RepID=A0A066VGV9_TILAU|nr:uncharacterized protein K437DRAFT_10576 [Tilletiaria anomala UBC 951]KDN39538.1 hypothetical protein K437DRAFT_10576 [Tilletiaria anomala UBC 951]
MRSPPHRGSSDINAIPSAVILPLYSFALVVVVVVVVVVAAAAGVVVAGVVAVGLVGSTATACLACFTQACVCACVCVSGQSQVTLSSLVCGAKRNSLAIRTKRQHRRRFDRSLSFVTSHRDRHGTPRPVSCSPLSATKQQADRRVTSEREQTTRPFLGDSQPAVDLNPTLRHTTGLFAVVFHCQRGKGVWGLRIAVTFTPSTVHID